MKRATPPVPPVPPVVQETPVPPVVQETPVPPVVQETAVPPVVLETPAEPNETENLPEVLNVRDKKSQIEYEVSRDYYLTNRSTLELVE